MHYPFEIIKSDFLKDDLESLLNYYINELAWTQDTYVFNGVSVTPKRKTFMFGKNYNYSGQTKQAVPFDNLTNQVKHNIENFLNIENNFFNGCLLNLYEDGSASISPHKDDEKDMDLTAPIVVLSIGETRTFILQNDITKEKLKLKIGNGDILIMYPLCQKEWVHSIPKEKEIIKPRISLTFRKFN